MNRRDPPASRPHAHQWLVYETSDRWIRVVRRFAPDFVSADEGLSVIGQAAITSDFSPRLLQTPSDPAVRRVVLWQVDRSNFQHVAAAIAQSRLSNPSDLHPCNLHPSDLHPCDLQIAAVCDLSLLSQMALSEFGIATIIRHPEQLPSLRHMIRSHFARRS